MSSQIPANKSTIQKVFRFWSKHGKWHHIIYKKPGVCAIGFEPANYALKMGSSYQKIILKHAEYVELQNNSIAILNSANI